MQAQVVSSKPHFDHGPDHEGSATQGMASVDRITSAIVWLSYCGLISAGITVLGW